ESTSRQQSQRNLIQAFKRYYDPNLKSNYPVFKHKRNAKDNFRIINNNHNVRIQKNRYGFEQIKLAKLGLIKFKTSKEYRELLRQASNTRDHTAKIKHVTIKKENTKYYAVFNIECIHTPDRIIGPLQQIGIDIGCSKLAVLSNEKEIPNLHLTEETEKIIHYQKIMSHHKPKSIRYKKAQKQYNKWYKKLINKRNDYYNKQTADIVKNSCFIAVQNENIIAWKHNKYLSRGIQLNASRTFMDQIEYKCDWNDIEFIKVPKKFPSTQICSKCGEQNEKLRGQENLGIREWDCQYCNTHHDRDVNAGINILRRGLELAGAAGQ
uniref:RNA-guided endonuclease InsQ/TnpB family protein n=1 Tax=Methanobrevibacter sp. TaxID=66852 RepID=UPI00388F78F2